MLLKAAKTFLAIQNLVVSLCCGLLAAFFWFDDTSVWPAILLDALPTASLEALRCGGSPAPTALFTALGPPLLPQVISYSGYRLECALRSATLLGVFGLGGLGTELRLTLQSLAFNELWSGLWLLLAVMLLLEALMGWLRRRWAMPARLGLSQQGVGSQGQEMVAGAMALLPVLVLVAWRLEVHPTSLLQWQGLPPLGAADWGAVAALPWPSLIGNTLLLTLVAAALAVGLAPLLLLLVKAILNQISASEKEDEEEEE